MTTEYTRGFKQYHTMRVRTDDYLNVPMGYTVDYVVSCTCGNWIKRYDWFSIEEREDEKPLLDAHKRHMAAAWKRRSK